MILKSFLHKGLKAFYEEGKTSKIPTAYTGKIKRILIMLEAVNKIEDFPMIGSGIHQLKGNMKNRWAINVSANYRITFEVVDPEILLINLEDYH